MINPPSSDETPPFDIATTVDQARAAWAAGRADEAEMACRQVLAVWPGQTDATYLLGLMAYTFGNLDLAITHLRDACQSPRAPSVYFSDFAEMCRQKGLNRRAGGLSPSLRTSRLPGTTLASSCRRC
jgi:predicted Zn-dependent protease